MSRSSFLLAVLDEDLRGLGKPASSCGSTASEDHRFLAARTIGADGVVVAVEIVEGGVGQPGFVEVQGVDLAVEHLLISSTL